MTKSKIIKTMIIGILCGLVVISALLIVSSFLLTSMKTVPDMAISTITMIFASIGALCSGYVAVRILKENGMFFGGIMGFILFVIIALVGIFMHNESFSITTLIKCVAMVLSGSIGGIVAVNKKSKAFKIK